MLEFKKITIDDLKIIEPYLSMQDSRFCDYTKLSLYMWREYFAYEYCIYKETLFIKGKDEEGIYDCAFSIPIGKLHLLNALKQIDEYSSFHNLTPLLSVVTWSFATSLSNSNEYIVHKLDKWSDYLYLAADLVELKGKKFNKKRNKIHKFCNNYPNFVFEEITKDNLNDVISFFENFKNNRKKDSLLFQNEENQVSKVLENYFELNLLGALIRVNQQVVAFSIGEIINDTLFIHIEKADILFDGSYEIINNYFAKKYVNDNIKYINREEDTGDLGLRKAKMSYHPYQMLDKYSVCPMNKKF